MASQSAHSARACSAWKAGGVAILSELLQIKPGVTAVIGSGGKSTLIRALADELGRHARVAIATSTKMFVPDWCPVVLEARDDEGRDAALEGFEKQTKLAGAAPFIAESEETAVPPANPSSAVASMVAEVEATFAKSNAVCVGAIHGPTGKLQASHLGFSELARMADYVLVEADGAKMLPLKAHASHEPVIPGCARRVICVIGVDGVGKPISQACHRPELFARVAKIRPESPATPESVAAVLETEGFHDALLINKVETAQDWQAAERIAARCATPVVAGSLRRGDFRCLR